MGAQMQRVRDGWAAVGEGWAVFAPSQEEAAKRYRQAEKQHREIEERPVIADGLAIPTATKDRGNG
jgi:hypothetical protein